MEITQLLQYAKGNPGAMGFLSSSMNETKDVSESFISALKRIPLLRGTNIYILCSDLCGGDFNKIAHLCDNCPDDILEEACSRQDYSGRELVKKYMLR